jgi:hypothetical protein
MGKSTLDFVLALGQLMATHGISRDELSDIMKPRSNGHAAKPVEDDKYVTISPVMGSGRVKVIRAPAEDKAPVDLFDGLSGDVPKDLPKLEGTIAPIKPKIRVKRDTLINRIRLWLLEVPKGALVTSMEIKRRFSITDSTVCSVLDSLRGDGVLRRKRDITGNFKLGTYVKMGKVGDAKIKRRLRGKRPN